MGVTDLRAALAYTGILVWMNTGARIGIRVTPSQRPTAGKAFKYFIDAKRLLAHESTDGLLARVPSILYFSPPGGSQADAFSLEGLRNIV